MGYPRKRKLYNWTRRIPVVLAEVVPKRMIDRSPTSSSQNFYRGSRLDTQRSYCIAKPPFHYLHAIYHFTRLLLPQALRNNRHVPTVVAIFLEGKSGGTGEGKNQDRVQGMVELITQLCRNVRCRVWPIQMKKNSLSEYAFRGAERCGSIFIQPFLVRKSPFEDWHAASFSNAVRGEHSRTKDKKLHGSRER